MPLQLFTWLSNRIVPHPLGSSAERSIGSALHGREGEVRRAPPFSALPSGPRQPARHAGGILLHQVVARMRRERASTAGLSLLLEAHARTWTRGLCVNSRTCADTPHSGNAPRHGRPGGRLAGGTR